MVRYLVNLKSHGYECITIEDIDITNNESNLINILIDKSCDSDTGKYYKFIDNALRNRNRVVLISVDDGNKSFTSLASLMVTFKGYDIYKVADKDLVTSEYLEKLEQREPDITEVQTYIGGEITGMSDMSTVLFGIESLVDEGNTDGLVTFIENNINTIENMVVTINNMKKTCDVFNSNELIDNINILKDKESKLKDTIKDKDNIIETVKYERDKHQVEVEDLKRENNQLKNKNSELKIQTESGGSVIKAYKELNTQLINCKTKIVLYFKEISYVKYTNSLVEKIFSHLEQCKLKVKLVIYDSQSDLFAMYKPLPVVTGSDYVLMKDTFIHKTKKFVVAEPNPSIIQDILTSDENFDVVIVYDRMRCSKDVVSGNNVTKYYVINSSTNYNELKSMLKITDSSKIITYADSSIEIGNESNRKFLDIPTIAEYAKKTSTESFKSRRYALLSTSLSKQPLIQTILDKSRISTLL